MQYEIISGRTVEVKRSYMKLADHRKKPRGKRIAGNSSERKIKINEREQKKALARVLNCNIDSSWQLVTLKFDSEHLPADYAALRAAFKAYMQKLRKAFRKEHGQNPRFIAVCANWKPGKDGGHPARFHVHMVIESCAPDMLRAAWPTPNGVNIEPIDNRADYTALAVYLFDNVRKDENIHSKAWTTSRDNLAKPIYTEPVEVFDGIDNIQPIPTARQTAFERMDNEDGQAVSTYMRCVLPEKPKIRGRTVVLPKRTRERKKEK